VQRAQVSTREPIGGLRQAGAINAGPIQHACEIDRNGYEMERRLRGVDEWGGKALARKVLATNFFGIKVS